MDHNQEHIPQKMKSQTAQWWARLFLQRILYSLVAFTLSSLFLYFAIPEEQAQDWWLPPDFAIPGSTNQVEIEEAPFIWASLICTVLLLTAQYSASWRIGSRHYNLVKHNHINYSKARHFFIPVTAEIPAVILAVGVLFSPPAMELGVRTLAPFEVLARYYNSAFTWLFIPLNESSIWRYFIPILLVCATAFFGYFFGYRLVSLKDKLIYKPNKK